MHLPYLRAAAALMIALPALASGATLPDAPGCRILPADNPWNQDGYGIPFNVVRRTQPITRVRFQYASESDRGPYPSPPGPGSSGAATDIC